MLLATGYNSFPNENLPKSCLLTHIAASHRRAECTLPPVCNDTRNDVLEFQENPLILNGTWAKCANQIVRFMKRILQLWMVFGVQCTCLPIWLSFALSLSHIRSLSDFVPELESMSVGIAAFNLCHASKEFHMLSWIMFASRFNRMYMILTAVLVQLLEINTKRTISIERNRNFARFAHISYSICMLKRLLGITYRFIAQRDKSYTTNTSRDWHRERKNTRAHITTCYQRTWKYTYILCFAQFYSVAWMRFFSYDFSF